MKTILLLVFMTTLALRADELTKSAQTELKELGFYYGESTGLNSPETVAAIKRYQIRNGYEVTGALNTETLKGLGLETDNSASPEPAPPARQQNPPPVNLKRDDPIQKSDRKFLDQQIENPRPPQPSVVAPPSPLTPPSAPGAENYSHIFARTPYEIAPAEVQLSTVRKAQNILLKSGLYRGAADGVPGPSTEEAILAYQRRIHVPLTGRLDLDTLNAMALLPGRSNGPPMKPFSLLPGTRSAPRVMRGVWVD